MTEFTEALDDYRQKVVATNFAHAEVERLLLPILNEYYDKSLCEPYLKHVCFYGNPLKLCVWFFTVDWDNPESKFMEIYKEFPAEIFQAENAIQMMKEYKQNEHN